MEFTEIHEIHTFLQTTHQEQLAYQILIFAESLSKSFLSDDLANYPEYQEFMKNLDVANAKLPLVSQSVTSETNIQEKSLGSVSPIPNNIQNSVQTFEQNYSKFDRTRSLIFKNPLLFAKQYSDPSLQIKFIKVCYFNTPKVKLIPYTKSSTIKQIMQKSIETYLLQNYDAVKANLPIQKFQMRLPISDESYEADMDIQSIHPERLLSQNLFQTLIFIERLRKQDSFMSQATKQYSFDESNYSLTTSIKSGKDDSIEIDTIPIILMDETYYELMRVNIKKQGNLEQVFKIIEEKNLNEEKQYVLKDDPDGEFDLTPDQEVKTLQSNRLYVMPKKYIDDGDEDILLRPIRINNLFSRQLNYLPPIGINEASKYEQFQVTKISSIGLAIQRILGIDQTKIYNYEKQMRKNNKQLSFVNKFLGMDTKTGTKKPFRYIKQITEVKQFHGGIEIVFPQKTTTMVIKDPKVLSKIIRKLNFLINWHHRQNKGVNQFSPKKNRQFFNP